ncbi:MAG: hypothetical protein M9894_11735 [Planctomycetes bacterium]|nr:hypothetical protein [Planctomycetota bacterium]
MLAWTDTSIARAEGLDDEGVVAAIDAGARVVVFEMCVTLLLGYYTGSHRYLVRPGESAVRIGALPTVLTALLGWWGIALLVTPRALWRNLRGGVDVTAQVRAERLMRAAAAASKAAAEAEAQEGLRAAAAFGTLDERRAGAMQRLEQGDVEGAWLLVGDALGREPAVDRDLPLLRRLVMALHDGRRWGRAERVATVLEREFPDEARRGLLATALRRLAREAGRPDGYVPPPPWWQTGRGLTAIVSGLLVLAGAAALAANAWIREHRTVHVVNGTRDPVRVEVAGASPPSLDLAPGKRGVIVVAEGDLRARIARGGREVERVHALRSAFLDRFGSAVVVLNVEGAGLLICEQAAFGGSGRRRRVDPPQSLFGPELVVVEGASYAFEPFPASAGTKEVVRVLTRVDFYAGRPSRLIGLIPEGTPARALDFLELHLRLAPDDEDTLERYVEVARDAREAARAERFLAAPDAPAAWRDARERLR